MNIFVKQPNLNKQSLQIINYFDTSEFRELGETPEISYAYTCPCKNNGKVIPDHYAAAEEAVVAPTTTVTVTTTTVSTTPYSNTVVNGLSGSGICGSLDTANWDTNVINGIWNCSKKTKSQAVRCKLGCQDGYETKSTILCRANKKSEYFNIWSDPRKSEANCENCSMETLDKNFPIKGGKWDCGFKDNNLSIKECFVKCRKPSQDPPIHSVQCRQNRGWKVRQGHKDFEQNENFKITC